MFGCCNDLFRNSCRCAQRCGACGGGQTLPPFPTPIPSIPPMPPVTPQPAPQLRGLQLSLVGSSAGSVANAACVTFDALDVNDTRGISYTPGSGQITIGKTGTYLVNWWIAMENVQAAESVAFALSLNGTDVQSSYSDTGGGQIYGTAVVNVTGAPSTLTLVNCSGDAVTLATASKQAGMTITQFA